MASSPSIGTEYLKPSVKIEDLIAQSRRVVGKQTFAGIDYSIFYDPGTEIVIGDWEDD